MTFRVETTAAAEQDADAILDWLLSQHAGDARFRWFLALHARSKGLSDSSRDNIHLVDGE
jgi:plasmid stabilization system protein ParE